MTQSQGTSPNPQKTRHDLGRTVLERENTHLPRHSSLTPEEGRRLPWAAVRLPVCPFPASRGSQPLSPLSSRRKAGREVGNSKLVYGKAYRFGQEWTPSGQKLKGKWGLRDEVSGYTPKSKMNKAVQSLPAREKRAWGNL